MLTKTCKKCGQTFPATTEFFTKREDCKHNVSARCKGCLNEYTRIWQQENPDKVNAKTRRWLQDPDNLEKKRQAVRMWQGKHQSDYEKGKRATDPNYKLRCYARKRIWAALKNNVKSAGTLELIGCSIEYLRYHLEKQFSDGMTWGNYGSGWHVDHVVPLKSFNLAAPEQQRQAFNYQNLQPLWAIENLRKHAIIAGLL